MKSQILLIALFVLGIFVSGCSNNEPTETNQEEETEELDIESFEGTLTFMANPLWLTHGETISYIWLFVANEEKVYYLVDDNDEFIIMNQEDKLLGKAELWDLVMIYGAKSTKNIQTGQSGGDPIYEDIPTIILKDVEVITPAAEREEFKTE